MLKVRISKSADKALRRMPRNTAERIIAKIRAVAAHPSAAGSNLARLAGGEGYRLRIGDWRVIYKVQDGIMFVMKIAPRGGAYR